MVNIPLEESRKIAEELFNNYIKNIEISGINEWDTDYFSDSNRSKLCFRKLDESPVLENYISGGYVAALNFTILHQTILPPLDAIIPLNQLSEVFQEEVKNEFKNLTLICGKPLMLEMITNPVCTEKNENGNGTYTATYKLTYKMKGAFEK